MFKKKTNRLISVFCVLSTATQRDDGCCGIEVGTLALVDFQLDAHNSYLFIYNTVINP